MKKKKILFVESSATDIVAKIAYVLKKKGYETSLFTIIHTESNFYSSAYNKIITLDFKFFRLEIKNSIKIFNYGLKKSLKILKGLYNLKKLKPDIIIVRTTPNWLFSIVKKGFNNYPIIYYPYDIRSFCYDNYDEAIKLGIPNFEIRSERDAFEKADGILHKGNPGELKKLDSKVFLKEIKIKCPIIHFYPYCLKEFNITPNTKKTKKDKDIHIVFVGHVEFDENYCSQMEKIIEQKMHLHLYCKTANLSVEEIQKKMHNNKKIIKLLKTKYLHIHDQVSQEELSKEISKYDYGLWFDGSNGNNEKKGITEATGNKMASFFEAGLPFFYPDNSLAIHNIMKKYYLNLSFNIKNLNKLKSRIDKLDEAKLKNKVLKARKDFDLEKNMPRLEKFFEEVIEYKKINE